MTTRRISSSLKDLHAKAGYKYAEDIISGKIDACRYVKQACQRSIDDYRRQKDTAYHFDQNKAGRVCRFIELLPHVKGPLTGQKIKLLPFQCFILTQLFGWCLSDGNRRFRRSLLFLGRGNGKSSLASGIALYMFAADSNQADCYTAATSRDQAGIVFRDAQHMARTSPELCAKLGIRVLAHQLEIPSKNSRFTFLSSESHGLDGKNISLGVLDELAQHPDSRVYDAIVTGAGKRPNSMIFSITTAGSNQVGPGFQQHEYLRTVLNGTVEDDQLFGMIYTLDDDDSWGDEQAIIKANPGWGTAVETSYVMGLARKAQQAGTDRVAFFQKHLNRFTAADSEFLDMQSWARCADPSLKLEDFYGESVWIGLDLATKVDLSARILLFRRTIDDEKHYFIFGRSYLPAAALVGNAVYQGWHMQDRLSVTPGEITDFEYILDDLKRDCGNFEVRAIGIDPWQSSFIMQQLLAEGAPAIEYRNTVATMSNPMKELQAMVASGRLHHDNDPVMGWCMGNLVAHFDNKSNVFPRKNLPNQKIDLAVAAIFAIGLEMAEEPPADFDGILFIPFA